MTALSYLNNWSGSLSGSGIAAWGPQSHRSRQKRGELRLRS